VNDPPTFTAGASISTPANPGTYTVAGWASSITRGPYEDGFETGSLQFSVTSCTNTSGMLSSRPTVSSSGDVTYRVNENRNNQLRTSTHQVALVEGSGAQSATKTLSISRKLSAAAAQFCQHGVACMPVLGAYNVCKQFSAWICDVM
jgi:hypothetical protein